MKKTQVGELCIITDCGYKVGAVFIDPEDLWLGSINHNLLANEVKKDSWQLFNTVGKDGLRQVVAGHFIAI